MTAIGSPPRPAGEWDVPAAEVEAQIVATVLREAIAHEVKVHDDREVSALAGSLYLVTHPDVPVSTNDDYAGTDWPDQLAARIAKSKKTWRTS